MMRWPSHRPQAKWIAPGLWILGSVLVLLALGVTVHKAHQVSQAPAHCPPSLVSDQGRCCAFGQTLVHQRCQGVAPQCGQDFELVAQSCVPKALRIGFSPGLFQLGPGDWEAQGLVVPRSVRITDAFWLDAFEVTVHRWNQCVRAQGCEPSIDDDPARPVRNVSFAQAAQFCAWDGGALPTDDEWLWAASGLKARRYPWGDTGAVCRRGNWGVAFGPCAFSPEAGPDWAGLHSEDASPQGVHDLAGGVGEWVRTQENRALVRGGSWKSRFAAQLRTWHAEERDGQRGWDDVGLRCRYRNQGRGQAMVLPSAAP